MKKALIIFAKAPVPGTVKTRLQVDLGAEKTVEVYKSFVVEILSQCAKLNGVDRFLGCAPSKSDPFLKGLAKKYDMQTFNQRGDGLGTRIFNALKYCFKKGYEEVVLIGSDSPSIPLGFIKKAFAELEKKDLVIGPCLDRGLYLIGASKEKINIMSRKIELDTGEDVNVVLSRTAENGFALSMLPFWYDVDNIDGLKFLENHLTFLKKKIPYKI